MKLTLKFVHKNFFFKFIARDPIQRTSKRSYNSNIIGILLLYENMTIFFFRERPSTRYLDPPPESLISTD